MAVALRSSAKRLCSAHPGGAKACLRASWLDFLIAADGFVPSSTEPYDRETGLEGYVFRLTGNVRTPFCPGKPKRGKWYEKML